MDMLLAILSVVVFVTWCVFKADLNESSKLPHKEYDFKDNYLPDWQEHKGEYYDGL